MRPIRRAALAAAGLGLVMGAFVLSSPAGAAGGESEGACMIDAVHEAEKEFPGEDLTEEQETERDELVVDEVLACTQAPSPILPEINEVIWGAFGFFVVFGVIAWKGMPAIKKTIDERTAKIEGDIAAAEAARAEAASTLAAYQAQLADAKAESLRILEEARSEADQVRSDRIAAIEPELVEMRQRAESDADTIRTQALADLRGEVTALALGAAERVVERSLDDDTNRALIDSYIDSVGASRS